MERMTEDRKTYRADHEARCCWNCRHAYSRFNLSLLCKNPDEWVMEAAVSLFQFVTRHSASAEEDIRMTGELNTFVSGYNYRKNFDIKLDNVLSVLGTCNKKELA